MFMRHTIENFYFIFCREKTMLLWRLKIVFLFFCVHFSCFSHEPYKIYVRSSFAPFVKELFKDISNISIKTYSAPLLNMACKQNQQQAHIIIGLESDKKIQRGTFHDYVRGDLALIVQKDDKRTLEEWMNTTGLIIGQDAKTSSTGRAFKKWIFNQGYSLHKINTLLSHHLASLSASYFVFNKSKAKAMIGYTTTPVFHESQEEAVRSLKALPLPGAFESWGYIITEKGQKDTRTPYILEKLRGSKARNLMKTMLFLSPLFLSSVEE